MESAVTWEYMSLINELNQGMEKAKQLRFHMRLTSPSEAESLLLLQRILSSFEKALIILKWKGHAVPASGAPAPESCSISVDGSPTSDELNKRDHHQDNNATPKKRKLQTTWTEQVKVNSDNALEGPGDDGYSWRKYGQKDILGAKYPRSYYRCTYRAVQNCWATKQVQRSDEDPTIFDVTYKGTHTCSHTGVPLPASPEKQEMKPNNQSQQLQQQNQTLMNFKANLRVSTGNLDNDEMPTVFSFPSTYPSNNIDNYYLPVNNLVEDSHLGSAYSSLFLSPATSESNYFSPATNQMRSFVGTPNYQHSESDFGEILSANASTSNSPIGGIEFPMDPAELDPNFTAGFFS